MQQKRFGESYFRAAALYLVRWRKALFVLMILTCFGSLFFARNINIDNSLELWFLDGDPALTAYREFKEKYGNDEVILAMIDCTEQGMFSPAMLNAVYKASKEIENDKQNFRRVLSIGVAPYIGLNGEELTIEDIMTGPVADELGAGVIRNRFLEDPFKRKILQNASSTWAIIIAEPVSTPDMDVRRPFIIDSARQKLSGFKYRMAGMGVMYDELNRLSIQDAAIFNTVAYVVIACLVYILYRSLTFLFVVLGAMLLSGVSFLGFYGLFGQNFNMVTVVLPTLMMILSVSDVAYVYNTYCFHSSTLKKNREEGLVYVFSEALSPCLFTSLTNTAGFLALVSSSLAVLRVFGLFAGFACMTEYIVSMITAAFLLGQIELKQEIEMRRPFEAPVIWWMQRMPRYYKHILVMFAILMALSVYGITQLKIDTYSMGFLQESNPVRVDSDKVEAVYGNYLPLEVRLLTGMSNGILKTDFLNRLNKTHNDLEAIPGVEKTASILDVLKKLNQVMSDGTEATYLAPDTDDKISQLMMLYESDPDNDLQYMTNRPDYSEARLTLRVPMKSAVVLRDFEEKTEEVLKKNFAGTNITWKFGGYVPLYARIIDYITWSQISSFAQAFLYVFGAMAILFRRVRAMILIVLPNVFPVIMTLGIMGIAGVNLDIATVTIAAIAMGIVVDDTVHGMYLFYDPSRAHLTPVQAIVDSTAESGPAIVATSVIYSLGFLFMIFASIKSVVYFGVLLSFTIFFALICEITLLPAQVCLLEKFLSSDFNSGAKAKTDEQPVSEGNKS